MEKPVPDAQTRIEESVTQTPFCSCVKTPGLVFSREDAPSGAAQRRSGLGRGSRYFGAGLGGAAAEQREQRANVEASRGPEIQDPQVQLTCVGLSHTTVNEAT